MTMLGNTTTQVKVIIYCTQINEQTKTGNLQLLYIHFQQLLIKLKDLLWKYFNIIIFNSYY